MKQKLIASFIMFSLITSNCVAFSASNVPSKTLQGNVTDYRAEYINKNWWDRFNDPILSGYIQKAADANHDLKIATLRVSEYQALVKESLGKEMPSVGIGTGFSRGKTSDTVKMGQFWIPEYTENTYTFPLSVNYELDLWRKNHDKTLEKKKELDAIKYDEKAAYISLTTAVATAYFNAIKTDKVIQLQKNIISLRKNILELTKEKNLYGLCSTTDVITADRSLTEAESSLNDLEKAQSVFLDQLAVLTGQSVDNALDLKRSPIDGIDFLKDLPKSVKSDTVMQRPDILRAEAQLQSSRINVKLARKDFLPDISITGDFGFNSNSFSKAFNWDSYIASIGVNVFEDLFTGLQRHAKLKVMKYRYQEMLENYQKTILTSFQEVNDSLIALKTDSKKNDENLTRINLEKSNLYLINEKYNDGAISYLDTLQYKERVATLQKEQIESKTSCLIDSLSLYKAVGGKI